jgi:seryl-tRNA synthetase
MDQAIFLNTIGSVPKGFLTSEALLKIKGLIWTDDLTVLVEGIAAEEKELESLQVQLLGLNRDKKKCYKKLLELSLELQNGNESVKSPLESCKKELENLTESIENLEYKRDLFPLSVKAIENTLFQRVIETVYETLYDSQLEQQQVVAEIDEIRNVLKAKWAHKFDLDAKLISLDGYLHSVLGKDELDVLDSELLKGRE